MLHLSLSIIIIITATSSQPFYLTDDVNAEKRDNALMDLSHSFPLEVGNKFN